ncbi:50S ribosomal protein L21e [Candidatus Woesearchaeota archaeon]|nr:50S ribosomal protein L21e [Candidatus Woesearchaeota archaeon]
MSIRKYGSRRKSRSKLRKNIRDRGKISITRYLQEFKSGDKVLLDAEPAIQKGMYHPRYHSLAGIIINKRGNAYEVKINDNGKDKNIFVRSVHLRGIK